LRSFHTLIEKETDGEMVSLVTADGGIAVDGQEGDQEKELKRLVLCQFFCALVTLRKGGNFVCKVFDLLTDFSASLLYVMSTCFERMSIIKPYTSRPANSERYALFFGLREQEPVRVIQHFSETNDIFQSLKDSNADDSDIMSIFPIGAIPESFGNYLRESNEDLAKRQLDGVEEMLIYAQVPEMEPLNQRDIAIRCFTEWKVPINQADWQDGKWVKTIIKPSVPKVQQVVKPAEAQTSVTIEEDKSVGQSELGRIIESYASRAGKPTRKWVTKPSLPVISPDNPAFFVFA
jgi:cap1 methyltransferase